LNSIRVGVKFTNVLINTDKQMSEGTVVTVYDPTLASILDVDEVVETVDTISDLVAEPFEGDNDLDEMRVNFIIPRDSVGKYIEIKDGMVTITNPVNGATISEPLGDDKVVVDGEGQVYHIDAGGKITDGGQIDSGGAITSNNVEGISTNGQLERLTAKDIQITFKEVPGDYGFDKIPTKANANIKKEYTTIRDANGDDYTLVHQAVEKNDTSFIDAVIKQTGDNPHPLDSVVFKTKQGEKIPVEIRDNNTIRLTLKGNYTFENETIYAVVPSRTDSTKQLTAGALTLWHMTDRPVDVVLVSVNGGNVNGLATEVAKIFKKGVTTLNIETQTAESDLDPAVLGDNGLLDIGESGWLTNYNAEQKAVIADLKNKIDYNTNNYYVFVFGSSIALTKPIGGFMPLQRQFGFVFTSSSNLNADEEGKGDLAKTIAHEIGHGVFALQHPFDQYGKDIEGKTDWLMDYANGSLLSHMDWKQLHNPELKFYVFQDDEDGEIAGRIWFTPDWKPFSYSKDKTYTIYVGNVHTSHVDGTVPGFRLNGISYYANYDSTSGNFLGYKSNSAGNIKEEDFPYMSTPKNEDKVYIFKNNGGCGKDAYYIIDYKYYKDNKDKLNFLSSLSDGTVISCSYDLEKLCLKGKNYFIEYESTAPNESEKNYLYKTAKLICDAGSDELVEAQKKQYESWETQAKNITRNLNLSFSWEKYYDALLILSVWRQNGITDLLNNTNLESKDLRDKIFEVAFKVDKDVLSLIPLEQKVDMLVHMLDGNLYNLFTANHDALITKVIASVKDDEATTFLDILISPKYKNSDDEPLIYTIKENLSDFLNFKNPYTNFFKEINRLSDARNKSSDNKLDIKVYLRWDVEQKDYVLVSFVKSRNNYRFNYDKGNHTVSIETCKEYQYTYNPTTDSWIKTCKEETELLPVGSSPFDLVGLTIINDVSPFGSNCQDGTGLNEICGQLQIVPALFLDYLQSTENSQRLTNFGWNIFNVIITVTTFGEGAVAIHAVRTAAAGQKLAVAGKNAYALIDFSYSVADLTFDLVSVDKPDAWKWVGYAFAAKTSYDLINKGGAKGIGYLRKLLNENRQDEVIEIVKELGISYGGNELSLKEVEDFVVKAEAKIQASTNPNIINQYNDVFNGNLGNEWTAYLNKNVADIINPPLGYQFYTRNGNKWIRRLDVTSPNTPRLTIKNGEIVRYNGTTITSFTSKQIEDYLQFATKNVDADKVMLGMWDGGGSASYITKAGDKHSYFDFGDKWDEAYKLVNESNDEVWRINKLFIDRQKLANKEFWFSHDPFSAKNEQFFAREVNYLIELGVKDFAKVNDLWKAIW
jgi:hypothetical protein